MCREGQGAQPAGQAPARQDTPEEKQGLTVGAPITRRRIHHKLAADVTGWGHKTCFLCGRCDEVCPTGIGIKAVCREMIERCG